MTKITPAQIVRFFAVGVFGGALVHSLWLEPVSRPAAAAAVLLILTVLISRRWRLLTWLIGFSLAFALFDLRVELVSGQDSALVGTRLIEGIVRDWSRRENGAKVLLRSVTVRSGGESRRTGGSVLVFVEQYPDFRVGERVRLLCALRPAASPLIKTESVVRDQVRAVCFEPIQISSLAPPSLFWRAIAFVRRIFLSGVNRALPSPHSELAAGLILGSESSPLPKATAESFRAAGLSHIVAASGFNVSVVAYFLSSLLLCVGLPRRWRLVLSFFGVWFYVLLAGATAAVVRAGVMGSAVIGSKFIGRRVKAGHSLLVAAALMLLGNPALLVFDVGFELTLSATAGLVVIGPRLIELYPKIFGRSGLKKIVTESSAAIASSLPVILWRFGTVSLVALPANILIVPTVPLAMALSALVSPLPFVLNRTAEIFGLLAWLPLSYILNLTQILSELPLSSVELGALPWWGMLVFYGLLWLWLFAPQQLRRAELKEFEGWKIEARGLKMED